MSKDIWAGVNFGDSVVNPGGVYQTYNPSTGQTTYGSPPAGYADTVAKNAITYQGVAPAVETPKDLPAGTGTPQVAGEKGTFQELTPKTAYVEMPTGIMQNTQGVYDYKMPSVIPAKALKNDSLNEANKNISQAVVKGKEQASTANMVVKYNDPALAKAFATLGTDKPAVLPMAKANEQYINALFRDMTSLTGKARNATPNELTKFVGMSVKDATNLILGQGRSPFANHEVPGANPQVPDTTKPAAPEVAKDDGTIDPVKLVQNIQTTIDSINKLIADEAAAFDNTKVELGNQLGTVMPLIQGEQAYIESKKAITLQRLVDEKSAAIESGNLQLKAYEYSQQLRKDQQDSLATIINMNLQNGVPIDKATAEKYANLTGMDAQFIEDSFAVAAKNYVTNKNIAQDAQMLSAGYQYIPTPQKLTEYQKAGAQIVSLGGRSYVRVEDKTTFGKIGTNPDGSDKYGFIDTTNKKIIPTNTDVGNITVLADGASGGQCGDYVHTIMDGTPQFGDTWQTKQAAMNVSASDFASSPQVGDILTFKTNLPTGHVAVVTGVNGNKVTLSESNYKLDEKVNNNRTIDVNDKSILGAYRGATFKSSSADTSELYSDFTKDLSPVGAKNFEVLSDKDKLNVMQLIQGDALASDIAKGMGGAKYAATLLGLAKTVDPSFSENVNKQRYTFKVKWNDTNGKAYNTRTAVNTGLQHLARLQEITNELSSNTNFKKANSIKQFIADNINNASIAEPVAEFQDTVSLLAAEIAKAYKGGVPDKDEIQRQVDSLSAIKPQNITSAVIDNKAKLMSGLLSSQSTEYKKVMGTYPTDSIINSDTVDALKKAGVDTTAIDKIVNSQTANKVELPPLTASYGSLDDLVSSVQKTNGQEAANSYLDVIEQMHKDGLSEKDILQILNS